MYFRKIISEKIDKIPTVKRVAAASYRCATGMYSILYNNFKAKISSEHICCISECDGIKYEHLFGYYDKSPWNAKCDKLVFLRVHGAVEKSASDFPAEIILLDIKTGKSNIIGTTNCWNSQQACMLQWFAGLNDTIIYNDFDGSQYVCIIYNITSEHKQVIRTPIYTVDKFGKIGISLDFSRLQTFRPGYGYMNIPDTTKDILCPSIPALYHIDLQSDIKIPLFSYAELAAINHKPTMDGAFHKVNHPMLSPSGKKFIFHHRWYKDGIRNDRLLVSGTNGENLRILLDNKLISHCNWKDEDTIITFARVKGRKNAYYLLNTDSGDIEDLSGFFPNIDGHMSFSPSGRYVITDTYPDFLHRQRLYLIDMKKRKKLEIANVYASPNYSGNTRCDLHPRWKPDGTSICFDGTPEGIRQVYEMSLGEFI